MGPLTSHLYMSIYLTSALVWPSSQCCLTAEDTGACFNSVVQKTWELGQSQVLQPEVDGRTQAGLEEVCRLLTEGKACLRKKLAGCQNESVIAGAESCERPRASGHNVSAEEYIQQAEHIIGKGVIQLCQNESFLQAYMKQSSCILSQKKNTSACVALSHHRFLRIADAYKYQSNNQDADNLLDVYCMAITDLMECGQRALLRQCGQAAVQLFIKMATDFLNPDHVQKCLSPERLNKNRSQTSQKSGDRKDMIFDDKYTMDKQTSSAESTWSASLPIVSYASFYVILLNGYLFTWW